MRAFKCDHCGEYRDYNRPVPGSERFPVEVVRFRLEWGAEGLRHPVDEDGYEFDFCSARCVAQYFESISERLEEERVPRFIDGIERLKAAER